METLPPSPPSHSSASSLSPNSLNSGGDEQLGLAQHPLVPSLPPPPPDCPAPDMTPPPPPGPPSSPPFAKPKPETNPMKCRADNSGTYEERLEPKETSDSLLESPKKPLGTTRRQSFPVKQRRDNFFVAECVQDNQESQEEGEDGDAHACSDASDVFEDDVEAILFAEEEEDRRNGFMNCLIETHLDSAEYLYPAYLVKLAAQFTEQSALGKDPEEFVYCNNLLINPSQLDVLDTLTATSERERWAQMRTATALKKKVSEKKRRRSTLVEEALETKKIKASKGAIEASARTEVVSGSKLLRKRSRKKSTVSRISVPLASPDIPDAPKDSSKSEKREPLSTHSMHRNGEVTGKFAASMATTEKMLTNSGRVDLGAAGASAATANCRASVSKSAKSKQKRVKLEPASARRHVKDVGLQAGSREKCLGTDADRGDESSSSSSSTSSSTSSSSSFASSSSSSVASSLLIVETSSDDDTGGV
ncbi:unnamed protein product [Hyaloperonospora brassicae]|uniref:Uncharacterized protein n=1 Tax=Hyaloperonospora brassicae TaxID=162125 RepID=A0AAV0UUM4_HYABA|nr:unnamed protein product [Hyaloperonospora brassicae]